MDCGMSAASAVDLATGSCTQEADLPAITLNSLTFLKSSFQMPVATVGPCCRTCPIDLWCLGTPSGALWGLHHRMRRSEPRIRSVVYLFASAETEGFHPRRGVGEGL